jgi:putative PIN family toxin of toxin-antitoxin system
VGKNQKLKVFVDTNILISGIFFRGNESKLLQNPQLDIITSQTAVNELKSVIKNKFISLKTESLKIAIEEADRALQDISVIKEGKYAKYIKEAGRMLNGKNDIKIMAAVLYSKPDFFITGDKHFYNNTVKSKVKLARTKDLLASFK